MFRIPKMRPWTKHILVKYHHFHEAVRKGVVTVKQVNTNEQIADILTKHYQNLTSNVFADVSMDGRVRRFPTS